VRSHLNALHNWFAQPSVLRRINGWLTIFWILMIPVSIVTGWIASVTYVAALSLWALVSGHWSAWQAARVEVRQDEDANVQDVINLLNSMRTEMRSSDGSEGSVD
jgi:hypothetical protein